MDFRDVMNKRSSAHFLDSEKPVSDERIRELVGIIFARSRD